MIDLEYLVKQAEIIKGLAKKVKEDACILESEIQDAFDKLENMEEDDIRER